MTVQELYENIGGSIQSALRILQMDKMVARFIVRYLDEPSCGKLLEAYENKDEKGVFEAAHAMKGVCANLGLDSLSAAASEICEQFRSGAARTLSDSELDEKVASLKALHERTVAGITAFKAEQ
jgi:HPt (histidine-containing phosphotransfer) domain-containing protein